jgi:endoglucanase
VVAQGTVAQYVGRRMWRSPLSPGVLVLAAALRATEAPAQPRAIAPIRINQVGFYRTSEKVAVVVDSSATTFAVVSTDRGDTAFAGRLGPTRSWALSGEVVRQADFSRLTKPGRYVIDVAGVGRSPPFVVGDSALRGVARAAIEAFYFQRVSIPLPAIFARRWSRPAGHPDDSVLVHPSAASTARPAGSRVASPGGWYDAGDYNKYVVNSGISTYTLLALAEHFPEYTAAQQLSIPERGNDLPDVIDEALWNLRWMRTMQDPSDGGVYHKLTNPDFDGMDVTPHAARGVRYVVQKSTSATFDFAAVAAHASVVLRRYPSAPRGLADSLVREALAAWRWARAHPDSVYDQARLNARYAPAINTGEYGDRGLQDELRWAASELYLATKADSFLTAAAPLAAPELTVPSWGSVRTLGVYSLLARRRELSPAFEPAPLERRLRRLADSLLQIRQTSPYGVSMATGDFVWGSNAVATNQGIVFVQAYLMSRDTRYLHAAVAALDYVLGRNATGYSFVTGHGTRTPQLVHHRPSVADTVSAPVPGFLVGGPNPGRQDKCTGYPSLLPARSYLDAVCSYASNEVAINWNAPLSYLAAALDAVLSRR